MARAVSPGQRFDKGAELYRIADLSHVWVVTDIFEKDRAFAAPGAVAIARYQGSHFRARMSDVLPQFDPESRILKTRFELENPGYILRPDVFVDVELQVSVPAAVTVPADSVIDSGRRKIVYVDRGNGFFEPRLVETGWRNADRVQITAGLNPGERVVVSGNFLLDSESRMRLGPEHPAVSKLTARQPAAGVVEKTAALLEDSVCGMQVDGRAASAISIRYGDRAWFFCSEECRRSFVTQPHKYTPASPAAYKGAGARGPA